MGCSSCAQRAAAARAKAANPTPVVEETPTVALPYTEKTDPSKPMVKLRYFGGGYSSSGSGCRSCGGSGVSYRFVTVETIQFVSDDAADGMFKRTFSVGHDYLVTEKQAEYLLTLTYKSKAGSIINKFQKVEE